MQFRPIGSINCLFCYAVSIVAMRPFVLETLYWKLKIKFRNLIIIKFLNGYITEGERKNFI